ncbi:MAG TPA: hypothetical protein VFQ30_16645 [Ktedonobacteraceae bacterium]|nr:hypothetical protein [Ktedonobacteraceae bacterium]
MRPIEQYGTLRRGCDILKQQEQERWMRRAATLRRGYRRLAYRVGVQISLSSMLRFAGTVFPKSWSRIEE